MHNIMLSNTISNYTINHIKSSNIIKWLTVIQTKWERERERKSITKRNTNRLRECRNKKRIRVRDKMRTLQERKTEKTKIYQKYVHGGDTKINKMEKWRKIQKFMWSWKEGFLKNIHLHISKRQHKQRNYYH